MKLNLDPSITAARIITPESLALAAWYDVHPAVRRMWAIRSAHTLHVIVALEPTVDGDDVFPAWMANSDAWTHELRLQTNSFVQLELIDEPLTDEIETDAEGDIVAAMCWRDPALIFM